MKVSSTTKKIKCRTNLSESDSTTYEIPMAYFRDLIAKKWLFWAAVQTGLGKALNLTIAAATPATLSQIRAMRPLWSTAILKR